VPKKSGDNSVSWINLDLTEKQKAQMREVFPDDSSVFGGLQGLVEQGYKLSVSFDLRNDCVGAYAFPSLDHPENAGMALVARAATVFGALRGLVFRHEVVFKHNWRQTGGGTLDD